jgi:large subunit ribosomal protein L21
MYAVVRTGGKQVRVAPGDALWVERLPGGVGETIELDEVLLVCGEGAPRVGTPTVAGAKVVATIAGHGRGEGVIFKAKRRAVSPQARPPPVYADSRGRSKL